ncbi:uncharacterized protein LOC110426809 [Herrania umbratica]|uniref:Uncharacterized protein LOC110426809 n=1 Tax=Herrania umbratica TaxID=108875 RepID=A0A6J1BFA2_9ROSI|nr:uncharacterized protein LOC110426809 [Herrania umbratica]
MVKTLRGIWKLSEKHLVKEVRENWFLFVFDVKANYDRVKEGRSWNFDRSMLVLKEFDEKLMEPEDIDFDREDFWIHIFDLPMKMMTKETANVIRSAIGSFIKVDGGDDDLEIDL